MRSATTWATLFMALAFAGVAGQAWGADPEAGKYSAQTCMGCHGIPGQTNVYPTYRVPKLGGQNAQYIMDALEAYRAGDRDHALMRAQASSLTDEEIENIAAYFESVEPR